MLKNVLGTIYYFWVVIVFAVLMVIVVPFMVIPVLINAKFSYISYSIIKLWSATFCVLTRIRYKVHGKDNIERKTAYLFISNHGSFLDIPGLALTIPGEFRPLAKQELLKVPVFSWIIKSLTVVVDRSSQASREDSSRRLSQSIKNRISIYIAPEGTRNNTEHPLLPFYDGAFRIAIETQAPVLPFVIINSARLMPKDRYWAKPGVIEIHVLEALRTEGLTRTDIKSLKGQIHRSMEQVIRAKQ